MWVCTQGHWYIRRMSCGGPRDRARPNLRVTPSEIGGGFGGKTTIFMEPLTLALSKKAGGRPVKLVMSPVRGSPGHGADGLVPRWT